jgi:regulator of cell morphogenesis and NO signaling
METLTENVLDVTLLEPRQKHPTIFVRFDELISGETLTIHNDHDPKPLYYQLLGERGNIFTGNTCNRARVVGSEYHQALNRGT